MDNVSLPFELRFSKDNKVFNLRSVDGSFSYDQNVNDEIMSLMEYKFLPLRRRKYYLQEFITKLDSANTVEEYERILSGYFELSNEIAQGTAMEQIALGQILWSYILDCQKKSYFNKQEIYVVMNSIKEQVDIMFPMQIHYQQLLSNLAKLQMECEDRNNIPSLETIASFDAKIKIQYENNESSFYYLIDSVEAYLNIIFYSYILSKPQVSVCQYCGKLFTPKTKKITLYCDRATSNGSTCKIVGARSKHKSVIESDPVLKKYWTEKHRIQMYCTRSKIDSYDYIDDYYNWLDLFDPKIEAYKCGEYDGEKLIKEIEDETPNLQAYSKGRNFAEEGY
jgi:hypothetical protein